MEHDKRFELRLPEKTKLRWLLAAKSKNVALSEWARQTLDDAAHVILSKPKRNGKR